MYGRRRAVPVSLSPGRTRTMKTRIRAFAVASAILIIAAVSSVPAFGAKRLNAGTAKYVTDQVSQAVVDDLNTEANDPFDTDLFALAAGGCSRNSARSIDCWGGVEGTMLATGADGQCDFPVTTTLRRSGRLGV